jgi:two-component system chemotaxis response regulator CheY
MAPTCLVVDDSLTVRRIARRILETNGFAVSEACDGQQALMMCRKELPDCVLLDWNMPVMNGLQCLQAIRGEFGPDRPKVVFCTAENDLSHIAAAIERGAQEYVMKPFDEEIMAGQPPRFTQP